MYSYRQFWQCRGSNAFWLTTYLGYGPGAAVAWLAAKLGLTSNVVSALSLIVAGVAVLPLGLAEWSQVVEGLWLAFFLQFAFWLDCADGPLARVTGTTSSFGAVLDKTVDMTVAVLTASVVGVFALGQQSWFLPANWQPVLLPLTLVPRAAFCTINWLKDEKLHQSSRSRAYVPPQTWLGRLKRVVGNCTDDTVLRLGTGVSWALGGYWEFALAWHGAMLVLVLGYLISSKKDFEAFDAGRRQLHE